MLPTGAARGSPPTWLVGGETKTKRKRIQGATKQVMRSVPFLRLGCGAGYMAVELCPLKELRFSSYKTASSNICAAMVWPTPLRQVRGLGPAD